MQLTANISLKEMTHTNRGDYLARNRQEACKHLDNIQKTARMIQNIRDYFDSPLIVHSGFRCPALNIKVGGSPTSQHMHGEAADFHVANTPLEVVFGWIRISGLQWGQLILEGDPPSWIHMSIPGGRDPKRCQQVMTWTAADGYRLV